VGEKIAHKVIKKPGTDVYREYTKKESVRPFLVYHENDEDDDSDDDDENTDNNSNSDADRLSHT